MKLKERQLMYLEPLTVSEDNLVIEKMGTKLIDERRNSSSLVGDPADDFLTFLND
jgi:hypothetical protein